MAGRKVQRRVGGFRETQGGDFFSIDIREIECHRRFSGKESIWAWLWRMEWSLRSKNVIMEGDGVPEKRWEELFVPPLPQDLSLECSHSTPTLPSDLSRLCRPPWLDHIQHYGPQGSHGWDFHFVFDPVLFVCLPCHHRSTVHSGPAFFSHWFLSYVVGTPHWPEYVHGDSAAWHALGEGESWRRMIRLDWFPDKCFQWLFFSKPLNFNI